MSYFNWALWWIIDTLSLNTLRLRIDHTQDRVVLVLSFFLAITLSLVLVHFAHSALTRHDHDRNTPVGLERSSATDRSNSSAAAQGVHSILRLRRSRRRRRGCSRRQQRAIAPRSAGLVASAACALLSGP